MQSDDAGKDCGGCVHRALVRRYGRGHRALQGLPRRAVGRRRQGVEHGGNALEQSTRAVEGRHGVIDTRRRPLSSNLRQPLALPPHALAQNRLEVLGQRLLERRPRVRCGPRQQQRSARQSHRHSGLQDQLPGSEQRRDSSPTPRVRLGQSAGVHLPSGVKAATQAPCCWSRSAGPPACTPRGAASKSEPGGLYFPALIAVSSSSR